MKLHSIFIIVRATNTNDRAGEYVCMVTCYENSQFQPMAHNTPQTMILGLGARPECLTEEEEDEAL